jgi:hypothetical protein
MSDKADLDELARRYLDLWQDQMSALAADKDFTEALQKLMTNMGLAATAGPDAWSAWPAMMAGLNPAAFAEKSGHGQSGDRAGGRDGGSPGGSPAGAPSPAHASDGGLARLDEFARRLAALEERIATLEAGAPRSRKRASGGPRKSRS